jgi:hypothetical protein
MLGHIDSGLGEVSIGWFFMLWQRRQMILNPWKFKKSLARKVLLEGVAPFFGSVG